MKKAARILWIELEKKYAKKFLIKKGNVTQLLRKALGALLFQKEYGFSAEKKMINS
ncbi:MAG: hypothetical protein GX180_09120 [Enterococcus sp.]|nr:hypothetical protein [Enterococcus sp.]